MSQFDVFISHSSADKAWTRRFAESLKHRGLRVWLDEEQLSGGRSWQRQLEKGLRSSELVLAVVNPKNLRDPNAFFELGAAVGMGKRVALIVPEQLQSDADLPISQRYVVTKSTPAKTADRIRDELRVEIP